MDAMMLKIFIPRRIKMLCAAAIVLAAVIGLWSVSAPRCFGAEEKEPVRRPEPAFPGEPEESILEEGETSTLQFLIDLSGHVHKEQFNGVQAILTLTIPPDASTNPYLLTIEGYPKRNGRNALFWISGATTMTARGGDIVSELKPAVGIRSGIHFFFLSPVLLEKRIFLTQLEKQRKQQAEAVALPTKIFAKAGKLTLSLRKSSVSGTVWMNGYDDVERSYVTYSASFNGRKTIRLRSTEELKK